MCSTWINSHRKGSDWNSFASKTTLFDEKVDFYDKRDQRWDMTNCNSLSMAEITTIVVRNMENGTHIGKRSKGGICGLSSDNATFTNNYMGHIGERGKTPVYVYLPSVATFTLDKKIIEGEGITPDIEVDFDEATFKATGRDTQLDRALQFLRTGH